MKVLLLGGTGAMGVHLADLLAEGGAQVSVTSRQARVGSKGLRYLTGNARDMVFLQPVLDEKWDVIIDFMVYQTDAFKERVGQLLGATSQYVFLSSARVYADSAEPIKEDSHRLLETSTDEDYLASDEYALKKARQEDVLRHCGRNNWTIIRPYITYSENRLQLGVLEKEGWLYRALRGRTIVFSSDICAQLTTLTYGLNVAEGICAILGKAETLGQTFHITAKDPIRWERVLDVYIEELNRHLGYAPKVLMVDLETFCQVQGSREQIYYDRMFNRVFDNSAITCHLDTEHFIKAESGLRQCIRSFLASPSFSPIDWRREAKKDQLTAERASLREMRGLKQKIKYFVYRYFKK
jgi:nucleoside-diphosphate-sugar epimerase